MQSISPQEPRLVMLVDTHGRRTKDMLYRAVMGAIQLRWKENEENPDKTRALPDPSALLPGGSRKAITNAYRASLVQCFTGKNGDCARRSGS